MSKMPSRTTVLLVLGCATQSAYASLGAVVDPDANVLFPASTAEALVRARDVLVEDSNTRQPVTMQTYLKNRCMEELHAKKWGTRLPDRFTPTVANTTTVQVFGPATVGVNIQANGQWTIPVARTPWITVPGRAIVHDITSRGIDKAIERMTNRCRQTAKDWAQNHAPNGYTYVAGGILGDVFENRRCATPTAWQRRCYSAYCDTTFRYKHPVCQQDITDPRINAPCTYENWTCNKNISGQALFVLAEGEAGSPEQSLPWRRLLGYCSPDNCIWDPFQASLLEAEQTQPAFPQRQLAIPVYECKRHLPSFRQLCYHASTSRLASRTWPASMTIAGRTFDIGDSIIAETAIRPHMDFTLDWSSNPKCWPNGLSNADFVSIIDDSTVIPLRPGTHSYKTRIDAPLFSDLGSDIQLEVFYEFEDQSAVFLPYGIRIPNQCWMGLPVQPALGYRREEIAALLDEIQNTLEARTRLITRCELYHELLLDNHAQAQCRLAKSIDDIRKVEGRLRRERDLGLQDLLPNTRRLIKDTLADAQTQGLISNTIPPEQLWDHLLDHHQDWLDNCDTRTLDTVPNERAFDGLPAQISDRGIANAKEYLEMVTKLTEEQTRAWALVTLGGLEHEMQPATTLIAKEME